MINLLFCGNEKVFDGVLTAALSVVMRLEKPRPVRIWIFTMTLTRVSENYTPMTQAHATFIENALKKHNADTQVILLNESGIYQTYTGRANVPKMMLENALVVKEGGNIRKVYAFSKEHPEVIPEVVYEVTGTVTGGKGSTVTVGDKSVEVRDDGTFSIYAGKGTFDVVVRTPGALTYTVKRVRIDGALTLPTVVPVRGDTNGDGMINIMDMGAFRQNFGKTGDAITNAFTDVNGDGMVNIMDMGTFRSNFGKTAEKDCVLVWTAPAEPVEPVVALFVELGEETYKGTEATFYVAGEKETYLVAKGWSDLQTGRLYALKIDAEEIAEPTVLGEEDYVAGKLEFLDNGYFEIDGKGYDMADACSVWQLNNAGNKVSAGTLSSNKNVIAVLNAEGEATEIFQYKADLPVW